MDAANGYFSDAEAPEAADQPESKPDQAKTALLPISFFQGKELTPGHVCEVRVEQVMDDQVSVSYVGSEAGEAEESYTPEGGGETEAEDMFA
jgi:hypothetical protein